MSDAIWGLTGLVGGFIVSVAWWYLLTHRLTPAVRFGEQISVLEGPGGTPRYRIKILNTHRKRRVIDCSVYAALRFPGVRMYDQAPENLNSVKLDLSEDYIVQIAPGNSRVIRVEAQTSIADAFARGSLILERLYPVCEQRGYLSLADILMRSEGAYVVVRILCFDEWSGSRKYFESPRYTKSDLAYGPFKGLTVVQ